MGMVKLSRLFADFFFGRSFLLFVLFTPGIKFRISFTPGVINYLDGILQQHQIVKLHFEVKGCTYNCYKHIGLIKIEESNQKLRLGKYQNHIR